MWHAIYRLDSGALVSVASDGNVADPLPDGLGSVPYESQPDLAVVVWDDAARMFVPRPPAPARQVISRQDFMDRIGQDTVALVEYASVERAGDPPAVGMQKAQLRAWLRRFDVITEVVLTDPRTVAGIDALIAGGLLPAERRDAVLAPPAVAVATTEDARG